jgi:uncharacterized membrane protein YhiD involved in acid resistance
MNWEEITMRLGVALLLGGAIGLERQWRSRYVAILCLPSGRRR